MGNWFLFWGLCLSGVGIPLAILYLIEWTVEIEYEISNAEDFLSKYKKKLFGK